MSDQVNQVPDNSTPRPTKTTPNHSDRTAPECGAAVESSRHPALNFPWCLSFFEKRGKEQFGSQFKIHQEDHDIIFKLMIYFLNDVPHAKQLGIDLTKGILLTGPIGCGKTSLMTLMKFVPAIERNFIMKPCRDISFEFIREGFEVINRYSKLSFNSHHPKAYCFDDLGAEQSLKYYGNECNIMTEIILSRYELYINNDMITHITTNLSATEIESYYGSRVRSRMREMFNQIPFNNQSLDKRN